MRYAGFSSFWYRTVSAVKFNNWLNFGAAALNDLSPGGGGDSHLPYKSDGVARRKIQVKPLRETNVGLAQA